MRVADILFKMPTCGCCASFQYIRDLLKTFLIFEKALVLKFRIVC